MFIYKMYGKFDDVTPSEYLQVQLDLSAFRLSWDENAAQCRVIEQKLDDKNRSLSQVSKSICKTLFKFISTKKMK